MNKDCIKTVIYRNIVFQDQKSKCKLTITNGQARTVEKHRVDGCLIKGEESNKCDWLAIDAESRHEIYIELKGKHIEHAVKQICASVDILSKKKNDKKLAYIIATSCPLNSTERNKLSKKIWSSHKLDLVVKTMEHTESIEKLIAYLAS